MVFSLANLNYLYILFCVEIRDAARGGAGGAAAPPDFGRSVNPISTGGADYVHHSTTCPPGFLTLAASLEISKYIHK